jgi:hypothetical protein
LYTYTFTFTNGTAGSADYTTTANSNCSAATTGTVSVPTTADTIAESNETLLLLWNASATGTINDNVRLQLRQITPSATTEGSPAVFEFLSNLLLW